MNWTSEEQRRILLWFSEIKALRLGKQNEALVALTKDNWHWIDLLGPPDGMALHSSLLLLIDGASYAMNAHISLGQDMEAAECCRRILKWCDYFWDAVGPNLSNSMNGQVDPMLTINGAELHAEKFLRGNDPSYSERAEWFILQQGAQKIGPITLSALRSLFPRRRDLQGIQVKRGAGKLVSSELALRVYGILDVAFRE